MLRKPWGVGSTMEEELGELEPVQRRAQRGSSKSCGERTLSCGEGELSEEPEFSLTVVLRSVKS